MTPPRDLPTDHTRVRKSVPKPAQLHEQIAAAVEAFSASTPARCSVLLEDGRVIFVTRAAN